jgi:hemoglobin-like flavoprotein
MIVILRPKNMRVSRGKISLPNNLKSLMQQDGDNPIQMIDRDDVEKNQEQIQSYIDSSRTHLMNLKKELYKVLDAGYATAELYQVNPDSTADYSKKPSEFLEKAYTIQEYDEHGVGIENRDQPYIKAGTDFTRYCNTNESRLSQDHLLLNDAGKMIGAINSALSQLNKIEASLVKAKVDSDEYEIVGGSFPVLEGCIDTVMDNAKESKLIKEAPSESKGFLANILSGLANTVSNIRDFLANLGKSEEQINKDKFSDFKQQYKSEISAPTEEVTNTEEYRGPGNSV